MEKADQDFANLGITKKFAVVGSDVFPNLTKQILNVADAIGQLGNGASKLDVFKVALSGVGKVLASHPILTTIAAVGSAVALYNAVVTTPAEAIEKMDSAVSKYDESASTVESLNSELETTQQRISELMALESSGSISFVDQKELDNLREANKLLLIQKDLAEKEAESSAQEVSRATMNAYWKNFSTEISKAQTDRYKQEAKDEAIKYGESEQYPYGSVDISYADNDLSGIISRILIMKETLDDVLDDEVGELSSESYDLYRDFDKRITEDKKHVFSRVAELQEMQKALLESQNALPENLRSQDALDLAASMGKQIRYIYEALDPIALKQMDYMELLTNSDFSDAKANLISMAKASGNMAIDADNLRYAIPQIDDLLKDTSLTVDDLVAAINSEGGLGTPVIQEATTSLESLKEALSNQSDRISAFQTAMSEAVGDTGLSQESVKTIQEMYSALEGYDPSKLFARTELGIRLNTDALQELEQEYRNVERQKYVDHVEELQKQYDKANLSLEKLTGSTDEYNQTVYQMNVLNDEINSTKDLISYYDALYSAYNRYIMAKNQPDERDSYEGVGASYDDVKQLIDVGWFGDPEVKSYLDLMLGENRTGDVIQDWALLSKTIDGTNHSLMDYWAYNEDGKLNSGGLYSFLDDVNTLLGEQYVAVEKLADGSKKYSLDFSGDKLQTVANALGTSTEMVLLFAQALRDTGFDIELGNFGDNTPPKAKETSDEPTEVEAELVATSCDASGIEPVLVKAQLEMSDDALSLEPLDIPSPASVVGAAAAAIAGGNKAKSIPQWVLDRAEAAKLRAEEIENDLRRGASSSSSPSMSYGSSIDTDGDGEPDALTIDAEVKPELSPDAVASISEDVQSQLDTSEPPTLAPELPEKSIQEYAEKALSLEPIDIEAGIQIDEEAIEDSSIEAMEEAQDQIDTSGPLTIDATVDKQEAFASVEEMQSGIQRLAPAMDFLLSLNAEEAQQKLTEFQTNAVNNGMPNKAIEFLLTLNPTDAMAQLAEWQEQLSAGEEEISVTASVDDVDTSGIKPIDADATAHFSPDLSGVPSRVDIPGTVHFTSSGLPSGASVNGGSSGGKSSGVSLAKGTNEAEAGKTLMGELGREIVVRDDHFSTVGDNGAEFVNLKDGDIVFNNEDTEKILSGKPGAKGKALAHGTVSGPAKAMVAHQDFGGGVATTTVIKTTITGSGTGKSSTTSKSSGSSGSGGGGGSGGRNLRQQSSSEDDGRERVDWIERAIKKIEREIEHFKTVATSTFKALKTRTGASASEISKITDEIELQSKAVERYRQEAESIGLREDLKAKVRDGTIDIEKYDEDTRKLISDYQEWIDKSNECADSLDDLHESLATIYQDNFNNIKTDFDNRIGLIESDASRIEHNIDMLEAKGYMGSSEYYKQIMQTSTRIIGMLEDEAASLEKSLSDAMSSGEIEEGSEAWYSMKNAINETREKIDETNLSLQETANQLRQIQWDYFDYGSERISSLSDEAEFLIDLMSLSDLFDKKGQITDRGLATMGLHGERYNVFMAEADRYAQEILSLDKQIANDPYNTTLLERREDLIQAQQESILAAQDEKSAIRDLVQEGIELELSSMQELIDKYTESLDAAKDLYDYQKKVKSQSDEIKNIQKQLSAYRNDTSEETRAKVQRLTVSLQDAQDDLAETEYQKNISDQKKLLSELYSDYEEALNSRLDDIDALVSEIISDVNANGAAICDTLNHLSNEYGYVIRDMTQNIWNGSSLTLDGILTTYGDGFMDKLTGVNATLGNILNAVVAMAEHSDSVAEGSIPRFKRGGLADFTGPAYLDGTDKEPEVVLNSKDSDNLVQLRNLMRLNPNFSGYTQKGLSAIPDGSDFTRLMGALGSMRTAGTVFGDTHIQIDIDHVEDYNDFVNKMREDSNFEKMIQAMTTDRLKGGSTMAKNKFRW